MSGLLDEDLYPVRRVSVPLPPQGGYVYYEHGKGWWGTTPSGRVTTKFCEKPSRALKHLSVGVYFDGFHARYIQGLGQQ